MKYKIPKEFMGMTTEEALKIVEAKTTQPQSHVQAPPQPLTVSANINQSDYVQIPQFGALIGKREIFKGKNWTDTHYLLAENGLYMPNPVMFMTHFMNVREASQGRSSLYDGNGSQLSQPEAQSLWNYLSSTDRNLFSGQNCWTWLDALFKKDINGKIYMETNHGAVKDASGTWTLPTGKSITLDSYLENSGVWADLPFNKQGLANKSSSNNGYVQGKNIYFWQPIENRVARFDADSDGACLNCNRDPTGTYSSLGVFACAEGTAAPKT